MAISKEGTAQFPGGYAEVFAAACAAAQAERMTVVSADPATGIISVSAAMSAFSWGENAEIRVWEASPGMGAVSVRSALKFGLVDWGRNKKNVDRLFARINEVLTNPPGPPPAGWHPDPTGRHGRRYWDGTTWTSHVEDAGVTTSDPL